MKTVQLLFMLLVIGVSTSKTYAASEGGETTTNLIWACYSLSAVQPLPTGAFRKSGCFAYSPTSFYSAMDLSVQIEGFSAPASNCNAESTYSDSKVDDHDVPTTAELRLEWGFPAGGSWDDEINASGSWTEDASGTEGSAVVGPYTNTYPPCY